MPFSFNIPTLATSEAAAAFLLAWTVIWLLTLGLALTRHDLQHVPRFMWVVVIIFVPFFGVIFYATLSPPVRRFSPRDESSPWQQGHGHAHPSDPREY